MPQTELADDVSDAETTPVTETALVTETTPVASLIQIDRMLTALAGEPESTSTTPIATAMLKQIDVALLGYLNLLETLGEPIRKLPHREREDATRAYQSVHQRTTLLARTIESSMERQ